MGLKVENIVASCTDGATNMTSEVVGVSGLLQKRNPQHIFSWCVCHRYNLMVEDSIGKNIDINEMIVALNDFAVLIHGSSKRLLIWSEIVIRLHKIFRDINIQMKSARVGQIRWWLFRRAPEG